MRVTKITGQQDKQRDRLARGQRVCARKKTQPFCRMFSVAREINQKTLQHSPSEGPRKCNQDKKRWAIHSRGAINDSGCPEMTGSLRKARMGVAALQAGARLGLGPTCFKDVGKGQRVGRETHGVAGATLQSSTQQVREFRFDSQAGVIGPEALLETDISGISVSD